MLHRIEAPVKRIPFRAALHFAAAILIASAAHAQTLYTFPDQGFTPVYTFINSATKTLDMTMYELVDTTAQQDLIALAKKGVVVRVILDQNAEKTMNTPAYNALTKAGVSVHWANKKYHVTHQKTITVDGTSSLILTANLTSRYYAGTRDFAVIDTDAADVAAIEATFAADFVNATITPSKATDLIWSPTDSSADLLALINGTTKTLTVESEEMSDAAIVTALENAAKRGVAVKVIMTNDGNEYATEFNALAAAGVQVHTYKDSTKILYIHAKVTLADFGVSGVQSVFVGSENYSLASLTENRELGLIMTNVATIDALNTTLAADFAGATPWVSTAATKKSLLRRIPRP
jgi:cardiolipin synthase A/B